MFHRPSTASPATNTASGRCAATAPRHRSIPAFQYVLTELAPPSQLGSTERSATSPLKKSGSEANVKAYARTLGFGFAYNEARKEYAHPSAMAVASPDGRIMRYLYGIEYPPSKLKLSLVEAAEGKIGNPFDRLVLYCFHYDATEGRYAPVAANIMRAGGAVAVLVLASLLTLLWRADLKKRRRIAESTS